MSGAPSFAEIRAVVEAELTVCAEELFSSPSQALSEYQLQHIAVGISLGVERYLRQRVRSARSRSNKRARSALSSLEAP